MIRDILLGDTIQGHLIKHHNAFTTHDKGHLVRQYYSRPSDGKKKRSEDP